MKNLKVFISTIALTLFIGSFAYANPSTKTNQKQQLRSELVQLLGNLEEVNEESEITASVSFIINEKNEVVVISVNSKSSLVREIVKGKLNYKTVKASGIERGEIYSVPLKIEKDS
ncbi:hypothetical protein [Urechidicola vernalis]|uniref:Uncharacterized protein n=1 Tax=Urechidicola vernalis TaxID=3075600 RepID=A0ABU2Y2L7_9FLAO|nr:hypothetical protein [Urechidicola sp. P050]MDT0552030.1 hypothetical protein [Urechidicola sp. P050]